MIQGGTGHSVVAELLHKRQLVAITEAAEERVAAIQVAIESNLAVLDSLVAFHEASTRVTQQEDVATTFYFDRPVYVSAVDSGIDKLAQKIGHVPRVLVCEDDKDVATLIALMLQRDGRAVGEHDYGAAAILARNSGLTGSNASAGLPNKYPWP